MTRYRLADFTTTQARESVERGDVVILPAGSFEQHGPAMPLSTDLLRAEYVAERVAAELADRVVIGPSAPVGISPHHLRFAGTVSLQPSTFIAVLRDYIDSLARHGWRRFFVITGHGGNNAALGVLAQELLHAESKLQFAWSPVTALAAEVVRSMDVSEIHGHSGEAETAQMLRIAPELVRSAELQPGTTRATQLSPLALLSRTAAPSLAVGYDQLSDNGVLGDPRRATAEQGEAILARVTERIAQYIDDWLRTD